MSPELHDLVAPPPPPDFRDRLWELAEERAHRRAWRWRVVALAATAAGAAAVSAATVLAFGSGAAAPTTTFDQTVRCTVPVVGGAPVFVLRAEPDHSTAISGGSKMLFLAGQVDVVLDATGIGYGQVFAAGFTSVRNGWGPADKNLCKPAPRIPLSHAGIPREGVYVKGETGLNGGAGARCLSGATITVRVHATIVAGAATAGQVAVRSGKHLRPMAFVDWTPKRLTTYLTSDCQS